MLKVTVDITPIDAKPSGVGLYVFNLIEALSRLESSELFELRLAYQPRLKNWLKGNLDFPYNLKHYQHVYKISLPVRATNFFIDYLPRLFPSYIESILGDIDIFHGTNYTVYPYQNIKKIISIYDLSFIKCPEYVDSVAQKYSKTLTKCLKWTDAVITISENSKQDIVNYLSFPAEKIFVTPLASRYDSQFVSNLDLDQETQNCNFDFSKPYLLFVSTIEPRKNIQSIIKAFDWLKQNHKIEHQLVLIGRKGWKYVPIFEAIQSSPWRNEIHHLNYLSDELVALFYLKADVFVYPSHYEGFGLPVLEAMTLGAPVVASNTSSIPEVTGDAALLINPNDFMQIAEAILKVISDRQLRQDLINRGKIRANLFSWDNTAKQTLKAYKSIL
jgi:glycosyltransferase involved in cell wall biosynthesis